MKKFALLFAVAFCLPVLGLTGCGGGGENQVIQPDAGATEDTGVGADEEAYNAAMEEEMNNQQGN